MSDLGNCDVMAKNIKYYMELKGKTRSEICKDLHVAYSTFSDWVNGKKYPRIDKIELMAKYFGVTKADLVESRTSTPTPTYTLPPSKPEGSVMIPIPGGYKVPVLGRVVAGVPLTAIREILDWEEIPERLGRTGEIFGLEIRGQSMEPTLYEGDVVLVRQQPEVENGEMAIVLINGDDATVKEIKESSNGLLLIGHNTAVYTPHFYTAEEVCNLPIQILGKVVELRRKF